MCEKRERAGPTFAATVLCIVKSIVIGVREYTAVFISCRVLFVGGWGVVPTMRCVGRHCNNMGGEEHNGEGGGCT